MIPEGIPIENRKKTPWYTNWENWAKILVIGLLLTYAVAFYPYYYPLPQITSAIVAFVLGLMGILAAPWGHLLIVENLPVLEVSAECSGVVLMMIFPLVIFLIPSVPLRHRMASLLFVPVLFVGNIIRITIDVLLGLYHSVELLVFFHDTVGQVLIFLWAVVMYLAWLKLFNNMPKEQKVIHPMGYD